MGINLLPVDCGKRKTFQTQQKIMDSAGIGSFSRYKRNAEEDKIFQDAQKVQTEFVENEQKMAASLKEVDELIADRIKYRKEVKLC